MVRTHSAKAGDADSELLVRHVKYILKEKVERVFGTYQMTISYLLNKRSCLGFPKMVGLYARKWKPELDVEGMAYS